MAKGGLSLQERKERLIEDCAACAAGGGGMSVAPDGFEGSADSKGPNAGYDPLMKALKKLKKKDKDS